jgi:hypothetical protein
VKLLCAVLLALGCDRNDILPDLAEEPLDLAAPDGGGAAPDGGDGGGSSPFVTAVGLSLYADGRPFRFVGANRYDVASFPPGSGKFYCGNAYSDGDLDRLVGELASSTGATVLRLWAFQSFTLGGSDFSMIDRAIATARRHGLRVILTLENEWRDCTQPDPASSDGRKSGGWYQSGYYAAIDGSYAVPYRDYVQQIVARYKDEPAVAMWQLMNEAESSDTDALLQFAGDMAGVVKFIDGNHLLSLGTLGSGQPGTDGANYRRLHAVAGIDVVEAHDYGNATQALPGAPSSTANSVFADLHDALTLGKPFFVGEAGIPAPAPMYMYSYAERAADMDAKLAAHWSHGTVGFLVWSWWDGKSDNAQGWDFNSADPLAAVLAKYAAQPP